MRHENVCDADGMAIVALDVGAKSTLKARRKRFRPGTPDPIDTLPQAWRELLVGWLKRGARTKWETLLKNAGPSQVEAAHGLLDWLSRTGWIAIVENRAGARWLPIWIEFNELRELRRRLGMPDLSGNAERWHQLRAALTDQNCPEIAAALAQLDDAPVARALNRGELIKALLRWQSDQRSGTRRDFALFARGETKAITQAEWDWLVKNVHLAGFGIEPHTPLLLVSANIAFVLEQGCLNLEALPDFAALTQTTLQCVQHIKGEVGCWQLIENRTSFERQTRKREVGCGLIWLPGFPPTWWRDAVRKLLSLAPAPALIACDPDPAGIEIAMAAGELWTAAGLSWQAWNMEPAKLAALPKRQPLTVPDCERLLRLTSSILPPPLGELAEWMRDHGEKGEQEGYL